MAVVVDVVDDVDVDVLDVVVVVVGGWVVVVVVVDVVVVVASTMVFPNSSICRSENVARVL